MSVPHGSQRYVVSELVPPRPRGMLPAGIVLGTAIGYLGVLLGSLFGWWEVVAGSALVVAAGELTALKRAPMLPFALRVAGVPLVARWALLVAGLATLATRGTVRDSTVAPAVVACVAACLAAALVESCALVVAHLRKSRVLTRNLPLAGVSVPPEPRWLTRRGATLLWPALIVPVLAGALHVGDAVSQSVLVVSAVAATLGSVVLTLAAAQQVLIMRRAALRHRVPEAAAVAIGTLAPEVLLYFGGSVPALYQVEMWLQVMEESGHRTLVVVREPAVLRALAPTSLPVLCIEHGGLLMSYDLPSVRAALFVTNAGSNIHVLRRRGMRSAFIGHGDSDKAASTNPFTKVYDELWVAGPSAAERFRRETLGVLDRLVEVGRPQTALARDPRWVTTPTVLYAPTWEGWGDEPFHSSLEHSGVRLVAHLLATPGIRLIYRPHPLTGSRNAATRRAHHEVLRLLSNAHCPDLDGSPVPEPSWNALRVADDFDDVAMATQGPQDVSTALADARREALAARRGFWTAAGPTTPRLSAGPWPGLDSCFAEADLLIADVSSVVSDWVPRDRPYAVVNSEGLGADEFLHRYPSARGGRLLGPGAEGLDEVVDDLLSGRDPDAQRRRTVSRELLGDRPDLGLQQFAAALDAIVASPDKGREAAAATGST